MGTVFALSFVQCLIKSHRLVMPVVTIYITFLLEKNSIVMSKVVIQRIPVGNAWKCT